MMRKRLYSVKRWFQAAFLSQKETGTILKARLILQTMSIKERRFTVVGNGVGASWDGRIERELSARCSNLE